MAVEIDMLPRNRRDLLEEVSALHVAGLFFISEQIGQDRGVVVDDTVGNEATTLPPELLLVFGGEAQLAEVGIGDSAA
jgi:hypothetical protein